MKLPMIVFVLSMTFGASPGAFSEETTGEKIENKVDEVKKDVKSDARAAKRNVRNATCTDARRAAGKCGVAKDLRDSAQNAGDELSHEGKKLKNKID